MDVDKANCINRLYAWVLSNDMKKNNVKTEDIIKGIEHMKSAYKHKGSNLASDYSEAADFRSPAYRCAYLHKFAPMHTILVSEIVERVVILHYNYFYDLIISSGCVKVCSLGGGPGSDIVGIVLALHNAFGPFHIFTSVLDCMPHWNETLKSLISETQQGNYGKLKTYFSKQYFDWKYIGANLLDDSYNKKVTEAISTADVINMIKFVSAAVCVDTPSMIKRIFNLMKPGAVVFFVDNSVGEVKHILTRTAEECELEPLYGPINHEHYVNRLVETTRFGYSSCFQTKIAIQVWTKPHRPVQTWLGSPVEAWTPFGTKKSKPVSANLQSTPNDEPFCNVSKSLFTALDEEHDSGSDNDEQEFSSNKIGYSTPARKIKRRVLSSSPDSLLSSTSNSSPSVYNTSNSFSSPAPFKERKNFKLKRTFEDITNSNASLRTNQNSQNKRSFYNSRFDSGCWSGSSSFNTTDSFNSANNADYRISGRPANIQNFSYISNTNRSSIPYNQGNSNTTWRPPVWNIPNNGWVPPVWNKPNNTWTPPVWHVQNNGWVAPVQNGMVAGAQKSGYEQRNRNAYCENIPGNDMNAPVHNNLWYNQRPNVMNDFPKASSRFANREERRYVPYKNNVNRI